jgi:hypothetical protein
VLVVGALLLLWPLRMVCYGIYMCSAHTNVCPQYWAGARAGISCPRVILGTLYMCERPNVLWPSMCKKPQICVYVSSMALVSSVEAPTIPGVCCSMLSAGWHLPVAPINGHLRYLR